MSMAQNPKVMRKLSEKLGPLYQKAGMGGAAAPQAPPTQVKLCSFKLEDLYVMFRCADCHDPA